MQKKKRRTPRAGIGNRRPRARTYHPFEKDWQELPEPRPPAFDFEFPPPGETKWIVPVHLDTARDRDTLKAEWAEILTRILWLDETRSGVIKEKNERERVLALWHLWGPGAPRTVRALADALGLQVHKVAKHLRQGKAWSKAVSE